MFYEFIWRHILLDDTIYFFLKGQSKLQKINTKITAMQAAKNNETIQNLDMLLVITTFETLQTNQEAILGYLDVLLG